LSTVRQRLRGRSSLRRLTLVNSFPLRCLRSFAVTASESFVVVDCGVEVDICLMYAPNMPYGGMVLARNTCPNFIPRPAAFGLILNFAYFPRTVIFTSTRSPQGTSHPNNPQ